MLLCVFNVSYKKYSGCHKRNDLCDKFKKKTVYLLKERIRVLMVRTCMMERRKMLACVWCGNLTERDQLEELGVMEK